MAEKPLPINEVVAQNLAYWMGQAGGMSQTTLAEKAGVSQKTISNYLNPAQRTESASGKQPSAKLSELDAIAKALAVDVWQLTRQMTMSERLMYAAIEKAYADLRSSVAAGSQEAIGNAVRQPAPVRPEYAGMSTDELKRELQRTTGDEGTGNAEVGQPRRVSRPRGGKRA